MSALTRTDCIAKVREHFSKPDAVFAMQSVYGDQEWEEGDPFESSCVYRLHEDPTSPVRCAFGVLIPDEMYDRAMESRTASHVLDGGLFISESRNDYDPESGEYAARYLPNLRALFELDVDATWLNQLQAVHDTAARDGDTITDFLAKLDEFEANYVD